MALQLGGLPIEQGQFRVPPMSARDLAMWTHDVAMHIGASLGGRPTLHAVREGAREAGYRVDSKGRIACRFDSQYWRRVPHKSDA
jgi:hypothetical protein